MAKCGITRRYPVKVVTVHDGGTSDAGVIIGDAETLRQAIAMTERQGFSIRDDGDGGKSRFVPDQAESNPYFIVTVYPT